jgi:hypothetical protein
MVALTVSEFWRNAKRNIPLVILISGMAMVLVMIFSIIRHQYALYRPFSIFQGQQGYYYMAGGEEIDWKSVDKTAEVYDCYLTSVYASQQMNTSYLMVASPEWIWGSWKPRLQSGSWFTDIDAQELQNTDIIPVIIGGSKAENYPTGSLITCYSDQQETIQLYVIGMLVENTSVAGSNAYYHAGKVNYQMYYDIPYEELFFIAQQETLTQNGIEVNAVGNRLVTLKSMDSEQEQQLWEQLQKCTNGVCISLEEFNSANRTLLLQELVTYVPLLVTGLILIAVCTCAAIYVNQSRGERHYSIFYLVGADSKKRFVICMGNSLGIVLLSIVLCVCIFGGFQISGIIRRTYLKLDGAVTGILAVYYLGYVILTGLMSLASMKGISPKEALIRKGRR